MPQICGVAKKSKRILNFCNFFTGNTISHLKLKLRSPFILYVGTNKFTVSVGLNRMCIQQIYISSITCLLIKKNLV